MSWRSDPATPPTPSPRLPSPLRVEDTEVRGCVGCGGPGCIGCVIPFGTALVLLVSLAVSWWSAPRDAGRAPGVTVALAASPAPAQATRAPSQAGSVP